MNALFGKKHETQAMAVTLENGRDVATKAMESIKNYRSPLSRYGKEIIDDVRVRVEPGGEPPFEATMATPHSKAYLLSPGVRVQVKYDPHDRQSVTFDDDPHEIRARNPQLDESEWQAWLQELLKQGMQR